MHWLGLLFLTLISSGECIKCYNCDSSSNKACGEDFKVYQFKAYECPENNMCGKQTQPPSEKGWVGVLRSCYSPGALPGINETLGCHYWTNPLDNFTALFCFCDTDMCNQASWFSSALPLTLVSSAVILFMQKLSS